MKDIQPAISIQNLTVGYQQKMILQDISFDINKNEVIAILGLNGTGKSTLLRTIAGLQPKLNGTIFINGENINNYSFGDFSKQASIVLPGRGEVMQSLTVYELLSMARAPYTGFLHQLSEKDNILISETVNKLNIIHLLGRKLYELSDGESQKVFIARALIQDTPIILLDEPTSHLDIKNRSSIFSLISSLNINKTIVFATHELDLAIKVANKCLLIDAKGNFIFGKTVELINGFKFEQFFNDDEFTFNWQKNSNTTQL